MHLIEAIAARMNVISAADKTRQSRKRELSQCKSNPVHWINHWAWTYDPREKCTTRPFDLFPKQEEFIRWLAERDQKQECGLAEKSRDVGFTWLCAAYAVHCWLFREGDSTGFGSRKLDLVDHKDNPDCIFEKTHAYAMYLAGDDNGINYEIDELISIPDHPELIAQLSLPLHFYTETGKIQIESKKDMQKRGVASPDFADALVLAFASSAALVLMPNDEYVSYYQREFRNW